MFYFFGDPPKNQSNSRYSKCHPWIQCTNLRQYKQSVNNIYIHFDMCVICSFYLNAIALLLKCALWYKHKKKTQTFELKHSSSSHTERDDRHAQSESFQTSLTPNKSPLTISMWWWLMTSIPLIENVCSIECELKAFWNSFGGFDLVGVITPNYWKCYILIMLKALTLSWTSTIFVEQKCRMDALALTMCDNARIQKRNVYSL